MRPEPKNDPRSFTLTNDAKEGVRFTLVPKDDGRWTLCAAQLAPGDHCTSQRTEESELAARMALRHEIAKLAARGFWIAETA